MKNVFNIAAPAAHIAAHMPVLKEGAPQLNTTLLHNLYRALSTRRASSSVSEAQYVAWLVNRLPVTLIDEAGNVHVDTRTSPGQTTMFTSHTDTVHRGGGANTIRLDESNPRAVKWRADKGHALGADDGAGIVLMQHLIAAGVPALYVFFREEECGGIGSSWLATNMPDAVEGIERCISFDRADYSDVITHQAGGRCCSDMFAEALANALTTEDMTVAFTPDDGGVFTDSANLTDLIPECTNLSVGYKNQHGDGEWQDVTFLAALADQLVLVQWDALPTEREPGQTDYRHDQWAYDTRTVVVQAEQEYLVDALYCAEEEDYAALRGIVSEWLNPERPDESLHMVDPRRVSTYTYREMADGLMEGNAFYDEVLTELAEALVSN